MKVQQSTLSFRQGYWRCSCALKVFNPSVLTTQLWSKHYYLFGKRQRGLRQRGILIGPSNKRPAYMSSILHLTYAKIFKGEERELILAPLATCLLRGLLLKKEPPTIKTTSLAYRYITWSYKLILYWSMIPAVNPSSPCYRQNSFPLHIETLNQTLSNHNTEELFVHQ